MNKEILTAPAFPCVPIQDNYGRLIAPIPGVTKLEYFALKIWVNKKVLDIETYDEAIQEAEILLKELHIYQNAKNDTNDKKSDTENKIISIS
jgi:hypothetical protein